MNDDSIIIRNALGTDAKALLDIYAPYVSQTAITFEYDVPTIEEFRSRIVSISKKYPYIVAEANDRLLGYAYASTFKDRAAYQWSVETSIYLDMQARHKGLGRLLYAELERRLKAQGITNMNACITYAADDDPYLPPDSVSFHRSMGFERCAHFHGVGRKFGRKYDVIWMEKIISKK